MCVKHNTPMHAICGSAVGEEGHGASRTCGNPVPLTVKYPNAEVDKVLAECSAARDKLKSKDPKKATSPSSNGPAKAAQADDDDPDQGLESDDWLNQLDTKSQRSNSLDGDDIHSSFGDEGDQNTQEYHIDVNGAMEESELAQVFYETVQQRLTQRAARSDYKRVTDVQDVTGSCFPDWVLIALTGDCEGETCAEWFERRLARRATLRADLVSYARQLGEHYIYQVLCLPRASRHAHSRPRCAHALAFTARPHVRNDLGRRTLRGVPPGSSRPR
jgi:hypothetical protein